MRVGYKRLNPIFFNPCINACTDATTEEEVFELIQEKNFEAIRGFLSKKRSLKKEGLSEISESYSLGMDGFLVQYTNYK